jgi:hypothetical protein
MKRSTALSEIKWAGWHNDTQKAALIAAQNKIGKAASRREFLKGMKAKKWGEPCGCAVCAKKK